MTTLKNNKNNKWFIYVIFVFVLSLLIFMTVSLSSEKKKSDENKVNEDVLNSLKQEENQELADELLEGDSFLEDQEFLALAFSREAYLNDNLTELSTTKEVLGGTFFINSINWIDKNTAVIEYEDGHIALMAEVSFVEDSSELKSFEEIDLLDMDSDLEN